MGYFQITTCARLRAIRRLLIILVTLAIFIAAQWSKVLTIPEVFVESNYSTTNVSKVALLIENRPDPILAPLMLHFITATPPDWHFRFMGSPESIASINASFAIRQQIQLGKLELALIPSNMSTVGQEMISRFLTTLWLYETVLQPAEWLLVFQTDSMICANSRRNLDEFLGYEWVGAPWDPNDRWGGNGGLSLRRVSRIIEILNNQERAADSDPEDIWLAERLGHHPQGQVANGSISLTFSGENHSGRPERIDPEISRQYNTTLQAAQHGELVGELDAWRDGLYEPLGYHTGGGGIWLHSPIWGTPELRRHIYNYYPELKMTLTMDIAKYVPGKCGSRW